MTYVWCANAPNPAMRRTYMTIDQARCSTHLPHPRLSPLLRPLSCHLTPVLIPLNPLAIVHFHCTSHILLPPTHTYVTPPRLTLCLQSCDPGPHQPARRAWPAGRKYFLH